MLRHTDLCSGIGGFSLGFQWAGLSEPVLFCDTDAWCRKVLAKHWPDVPIAEDVKELAYDPNGLVPDCDILTAGYPCQPWSLAGERRGTEDDRHIWPEIFAIVQAKRPTWCVFENVYGHISLGLDQVLSDLEAKGYATRTFVVPACGVDAPHRRDRLWIVGYTEHNGQSTKSQLRSNDEASDKRRPEKQTKAKQSARTDRPVDGAGLPRGQCEGEQHRIREEATTTDVGHTTDNGRNRGATQTGRKGQTHQSDQPGLSVRGEPSRPSENVADTDSQQGRLRHTKRQDAENVRQSPRGQKHGGWDFEPPVGRVANGIPRRVDRLKGLGNAIVPQIAMRIGETIKAVN